MIKEYQVNRIKWLAVVSLLTGSVSLATEPATKAATEPTAKASVRVIEGQVTDPNGKPVKNAAVEWGVFNHDRKSREVFRTDEQGHYRVETTKVGIDYRLGVSAVGLAPQWRDGVVPNRSDQEPTKIDFKLATPLTVRGRVVDHSGLPIQGVTIFAKSPPFGFYSSFSQPSPSFPYPGPERSGTTDAQGNFTIRYLPTSETMAKEIDKGHKYALSVRYPDGSSSNCGFGYSGEPVDLKIRRADFQQGADAVGEVLGKVTDINTDQPIQDFAIVIRHRPAMNWFSSNDGQFRLEELRVGRRYQLFVYASGYAPTILYAHAAKTVGRVTQQISLVPNPSLTGMVANADGQPITNAKILFGVAPTDPQDPNLGSWSSWNSLVDGMMGWETVQRKTTTENGKFAFCLAVPTEGADPPVKKTSYQKEKKPRMMIKAPGYARTILDAQEIERRVATDDMTIELGRECAITIKPLLDGKFDPNAKVQVSGLPSHRRGSSMEPPDFENETYRIGALEVGQYRVIASFPQAGVTRKLTRVIEFNEPKTIDLAMEYRPGNCTLRGKAPRFSHFTISPESAQSDSADTESIDTVTYSTTADADGVYTVEGMQTGKYNVSCNAAYSQRQTYIRRRPSSKTTVDVEGETTHDIVFK